jgi:hypothetical protein
MKEEWVKAAEVIARGGTATAAAGAAGVDPRTVRRWRADEVEFEDYIEDARSQMMSSTAAILANSSEAAAIKLAEIVESGEQDRGTLAASTKTLEIALKWRSDVAIENRIRALELAAGLRGP